MEFDYLLRDLSDNELYRLELEVRDLVKLKRKLAQGSDKNVLKYEDIKPGMQLTVSFRGYGKKKQALEVDYADEVYLSCSPMGGGPGLDLTRDGYRRTWYPYPLTNR